MTRKPTCHLMSVLAEVPDPRKNKGKRHPLESILSLVVLGLLCGHKGYTSIATWARTEPSLTKALGFTHKLSPCAATLHNLLKRLDVDALEKALTKWVNKVIQSRPDLKDCLDVVSMDGKTMRATNKQDAEIKHLFSVVSHELGITLTQCSVDDKTNEIPISTQILKAFEVSGKVVTTDALLTQRDLSDEIVACGGHYLLPVKKNHKSMYGAIETLFQSEYAILAADKTTKTLEEIHSDIGGILNSTETYDKEHGRLEIRCLKASTALNEYLQEWPGLAQVIEYRQVRKNMRTGEETHNVQYCITSLSPEEASAERLLTIRRGHWVIENKVHWVRDVVLGEDASPVRCGAIPQVIAAMRNTAMSVLRFAGYTAIADTIRYFASKPKLAVKLIK